MSRSTVSTQVCVQNILHLQFVRRQLLPVCDAKKVVIFPRVVPLYVVYLIALFDVL